MEGFAGIARPLHDLTKKNQPFIRTTKHQEAFEELKRRHTLAEYNFKIEHRAGLSHGYSDSLSRRPCGNRKCTRSDCLVEECPGSGGVVETETTVSAMNKPVLLEPDEENEKKMDHGLSLVKVKEAQDQDPVIQTVISLLQEPNWRTKVYELGMGVVHLWSQRECLVLFENILHRNFERANGTVLHQQV